MKPRESNYGKGDFNRSNPQKFNENYDRINWSIGYQEWVKNSNISSSEVIRLSDYIAKKLDKPISIVRGSREEWNKFYYEFKNAIL
jgi:vesicle coat complex subunit